MTGTITISGSATAPATPDRAEVGLRLSALSPTAEAALQDVAERGRRLATLLDDLGIPPADRTSSGVTVAPEHEWRTDRNVQVGYRASSRTLVRVRDTAVLGRLLQGAVTEVGAEVDGPTWVVDPDNPARAWAYRQATLAARLRAEASAGALGLVLGPVVEITDTPRTGPSPVPRPEMAMARMAAADSGGSMPVEAGDVTVAAVVTVTFTLLGGD